MRYLNDEQEANMDMENLTYEDITSQPKDGLTVSIALPTIGRYGSTIKWSSNNKTLTNSGRVTRPRFDQPAQNVILTADFGSDMTKKFNFIVLPDEEYKDPQYMTDEEFFGKWTDEKWDIEGKFDYSIAELSKVQAAIKMGNYALAKLELLNHMKTRTIKSPFTVKPQRNVGYANMSIAGVHTTQGAKYYQADAKVSSYEYKRIYISVPVGNIAKGGSTTYGITARYNENSEVLIASKQNPNKDLVPKIELIVNGDIRIYETDGDATIRQGVYKNMNYGLEETLKVKMFGEFLGDETYKAIIRFNFSDLIDTDKVTSARLIINSKVSPSFVDPKRLIVFFEPTNIWDEDKVKAKSLIGYVYNFNGIPGGNCWNRIEGCDVEYTYQSARLYELNAITAEYLTTNDEKYAYYAITTIMDFINDKGMPIYYKGGGSLSSSVPIRSCYPRTLDTALRFNRISTTLNNLINSIYMTPQACTAILKSIWDINESLIYSKATVANWIQTEQTTVLNGSFNMPEFSSSVKWGKYAQKFIEGRILTSYLDDGVYKEATGGYNVSAFLGFLNFKKQMDELGKPLSPKCAEVFKKAAYYNTLLRGPSGMNLQYGDEGAGKSAGQKYPQIIAWYGDKEFEYVDSLGVNGIKPNWTSKNFPVGAVTFMRSDWSQTALYAFIQARGNGPHKHADDNSMIVIAYDRMLLNDAGIFTYTSSDPYRKWGMSTRAHNTVEINNLTQQIGCDAGKVRDFITTNKYDFLIQSTFAYSDSYGDHQRTVTFVKPKFWIVSDLMTPNDENTYNNYKQLWHMLPGADLKTDQHNKTIYSDYASGANIILASCDKDITLTEEDGWYDYNYQQLAPAKYAYYEKSGKGTTGIDCVIMPYENAANIDAQRIDTGAHQTIATAMKFKTLLNDVENINYYLLDYGHNADNFRIFDKYKTNSKMALITENIDGSWNEIIMVGGDLLALADGAVIVKLNSTLSDISFEIRGTSIIINTSIENPDLSNVLLTTKSNIEKIIINDTLLQFTKKDDKITL